MVEVREGSLRLVSSLYDVDRELHSVPLLLARLRFWSVAVKLFRADVVIINSGPIDHRVETLDHPWRPGNIVYGRHGILQIP